jgi:hypothetical protein
VQSSIILELQLRASNHFGWEDCFVALKRSGKVTGNLTDWRDSRTDAYHVRRFVLRTASAVAKRYRT